MKEKLTNLLHLLYPRVSLAKAIDAFGKAIEVPPATVQSYISRNSNPSVQFLQKVKQVFPQVNTDYFLLDDQEPFVEKKQDSGSHNIDQSGSQNTFTQATHGSKIGGDLSTALIQCHSELADCRAQLRFAINRLTKNGIDVSDFNAI